MGWAVASHSRRVKEIPEEKQHGQIDDSLAADGEDQGRQRGSGGLYGVDEYKQKTHHRSGVNVDAGKGHAVGKGIRIFQKRVYQRGGAAVADDGHDCAQSKGEDEGELKDIHIDTSFLDIFPPVQL